MPSLLDARGLPLSRPAPNYRPESLRSHSDPVVEAIDVGPEVTTIRHHQDCSDTLAAIANAGSVYKRGGATAWHASVPLVLGLRWAKECGAQIGTKEWNAYAKKKVADRNFSKLKVKLL